MAEAQNIDGAAEKISKNNHFNVKRSAFPSNGASSLTSSMTGHVIRVHGIIGSSWDNVAAFDFGNESQKSNLLTVLA